MVKISELIVKQNLKMKNKKKSALKQINHNQVFTLLSLINAKCCCFFQLHHFIHILMTCGRNEGRGFRAACLLVSRLYDAFSKPANIWHQNDDR